MAEEKISQYDLTRGNVFKTLLLYAVPILISSLIQYLYNVVDSVMVGQFVGVDAMGAVSAAGSSCGLLFSLSGGFTVGAAVIVGINYGSGNKEDTVRAIVSCEKLALLAGLILTTIGLSCTELLIKVTFVQSQHVAYCRIYMLIVLGSSVVSMMNNMHINLLRTLGDSRSPVIMLVVSAFSNVGLNYVLLRFAKLEVAGVAIATVSAQLISALLAFLFLLKNYPEYNFFKVKVGKGDKKIWLEELKMGIPMAFQQSMISIGSVIVQTKVNAMGVTNEYSVCNNINNISSNVINAFGSVISGFVAQNYGSRKPERIKKGVVYTLFISWTLAAIFAAALLIFSRQIVLLFVKEQEFTEEFYQKVVLFLKINIPFYIIWVPVPILRCAIQSMKNSLVPFLSCLVELPMRCVTAWVLGTYFSFAGLSFATPCALVAAFAFLIVAFFVEWKKKISPMYAEKEALTENSENKE